MPRIARTYSDVKVYHITIRGIDKQDIFFDESVPIGQNVQKETSLLDMPFGHGQGGSNGKK